MTNIVKYINESKTELKKVVWPSRKQTIEHTLMVIGVSLALAIFLGAVDYLLSLVVENIIQ